MSNKIASTCCGIIVMLFSLSGCGGGNGGAGRAGEGPEDAAGGHSEVKVAFCPRSGGHVKFLKMDTLEIIDSEVEFPYETICFGPAPSPSVFAALTSEAVYLVPTVTGIETRFVALPAISEDVRVAPTPDGFILLDRLARRLIGVNLHEETIEFDRSLNQFAEEVYYVADQDRIILVMKKGAGSVLSVLSPEGGESMTINLDEILCSAIVAEEGKVYLSTRGYEGHARLEAFRIRDLSRVFDIDNEEIPGSLVHPPGSSKIYAYHPESGIVRGIDLDDGDTVSEIPLDVRGDATLFTDEIGRYLYLLHQGSGRLTIISAKTDLLAGEIENEDGETRLVTMPDSRYILLQDKGGTRVRLYDGENFNLLRVFMEGDPMAIGMIRGVAGPPVAGEIHLAGEETDLPVTEAGPEASPAVEAVGKSELHELQIFASNKSSSSEQVLEDLLTLGIPAIIEEAVAATGEIWYRVKIGSFTDERDAEAVGEYLKMVRGLDFWVKSADEIQEYSQNPRIKEFLEGQDMDSDGYPEIAIVERLGVVQIFSLRSNRFVSRWRIPLPEDQVLCGVINYSDENRDGMPEALLPLCPMDGNYVIAWDGVQFSGFGS